MADTVSVTMKILNREYVAGNVAIEEEGRVRACAKKIDKRIREYCEKQKWDADNLKDETLIRMLVFISIENLSKVEDANMDSEWENSISELDEKIKTYLDKV